MSSGVGADAAQGIPTPPRSPTWGASVRPLRGFALVTGVLAAIALIGALTAWGMADFANPFDDGALDDLRATRALGSADGRVVEIEELGRGRDAPAVERVHYEWSLDGELRRSTAYADAGTFEVGRTYGMEFLPGNPEVNRLVGSTRTVMARSLIGWGTVLAIAVVLVLIALRRMLATRAQLRDGECAVARVDSAEVHGRMLAVEFRFDVGDEEKTGRASLPRSHPEAQGLRRGSIETVPVVHRGDGRRPLIVSPVDFAPSPNPR